MNDAPATENQVSYLRDLLTTRQPDQLSLMEKMLDEGTLTRAKASEKIDYLRGLPKIGGVTTSPDPLAALPVSRYALKQEDRWVFYELVEKKRGQYMGRRFLNRLIGAPGDWNRQLLPPTIQRMVAREILTAGAREAAVQYAKQHGRCAVCESPLSDPKSIERSMGPVCAGRF